MRRYARFLVTAAAAALLAVSQPAFARQSKPATPGQAAFQRPAALRALAANWEPRVVALGMWVRARRNAPPPASRLRARAEQAILAGGRKTATAELRRLRDGLEVNDPLRPASAFAMAWLGFDYQRSRAILFQYSRAAEHRRSRQTGPAGGVNWHTLGERQAHWRAIAEAEIRRAKTNPGSGYALISPEDTPDMLYALWERRRDPLLVKELLISRFDGAGADMQAGIYYDLLAKHPRELLQALAPLGEASWRHTAFQLRFKIDHDRKTVATAFPKARSIAANPKDPLQRAAQRLLNLVAQNR
jgi:hypothetical protein